MDRLAERGVLALTAGKKVLRLLPPLVITRDDLKEVGEIVNETLADDGNPAVKKERLKRAQGWSIS